MPIPNDDLNREWIDASNNNPDLVNLYRPCLVALIAFNRDHYPIIVGSGFIVGSDAEYAFAITAKHVLTGAASMQRPPRHAPSAFFINESSWAPSIKESELRALWTGSDNGDLLYTRHLGTIDSIDIACAIFECQKEHVAKFKPSSVLIDTNQPSVGDVVHMVTFDKLEISNYSPPKDISGAGFSFSINRRVSIRVGTVTAVYPQGHRQHKFPCFSTSIPAEPGMSGGMVLLPAENKVTSVCGVVSSDFSTEEAKLDNNICGESLIAAAWTSLSLPFPEAYQADSAMVSIFNLMQRGQMHKAVGFENIAYEDLGNGAGRIMNK